MERTIKIGEKEVELKCNAFTPILYRQETGLDLLKGMLKMTDDDPDTVLMTNLAFVMAKQAGYKGDLEAFLSQFEMMEFYAALPEVVELWVANADTKSSPKKEHGK